MTTDVLTKGSVSPTAKGDSVFKDTVLLVLSEQETDKYVSLIKETLKQLWPGHPECVVATNGDLESSDVLKFKGASFLSLLENALLHIQQDRPSTRHIFLLPASYCPLGPVDSDLVEAAMAKISKHHLQYVLFQWPGDFTFLVEDGDSPSFSSEIVNLQPMKPYGETSNALRATIWDIEHLKWVIASKREMWIEDARRFQQPVPDNTAMHYVQQNGWPALDGGFIQNGKLNPKAVTREYFPASPLVAQLRIEYCGADDFSKARRKYGLDRVAGHFSKEADLARAMEKISRRDPADGPAEVFENTVLLVPTYSRNEHFVPAVLETLNRFWPGHPECVVSTDGQLDLPEVMRFERMTFVEMLLAAARRIKEEKPATRYIFLMLEDLCPLAPVDIDMIETAMLKVKQHDLKYVLLPWPGDFSAILNRLAGPTIYGPDVELVPMQEDWEAPNSLVTAIWDIDHLIWLAERKLESGINDPWGFEHPLKENTDLHYMQMNGWPTVQDGFYVRGKLNHKAVTRSEFPPSPILTKIRREFCGVDNLLFARLKHGLSALPQRFTRQKKRKLGLNTAKANETAKPAGDL